jgi:hypothetical protein
MESEEEVSANTSITWFDISKGTDFYLQGKLVITEGTVLVRYSLDNIVLYEEEYEPGTYDIKTSCYEDYYGRLSIEIISSDDVSGTYNVTVFTRENKIRHFINNYFIDD